MHFYTFHVGDHAAKAAHLTLLEEGVFRRLLDLCFTSDGPIPLDVGEACRLVRARSRAEKGAVCRVLTELFKKTDAGFSHPSAERQIADFRSRCEQNRQSALKRWKAASSSTTNDASALPAHCVRSPPISHLPSPISHGETPSEPDGSGAPSGPPNPADVIFGLGVGLLTRSGVADKQARAVLGKVRKVVGDEKAAALVAQASATVPALTDPQAWLMAAARGGGETEAERRMRLRREAMI